MPSRTHSYDGSLLQPGDGVWRVERADRYAVLMENDAYFEALSSALNKARRSIVILGWQFDPRTHLTLNAPADDRTAEIGHQLRLLVKRNPELDVRLLIWKSPLLIAASQGFYPHRAQRWFRKRTVEFRLDSPGPMGACHHQKAVIIDDKVAFCGGGDIATDRWDSERHLDGDPRRCQPSGVICPPRHETMCVFDGAAARALGDLARERWRRAVWERTEPVDVEGDPWPEGVEPVIRDVRLGLSRTEPDGATPEVRENEALHLAAIRAARRLIYLENQYFTSAVVAEALAARLAEPDGPEVVLITTGRSPSWFDQLTMDKARAQVLYRLEQADRHNRFLALAPRTTEGGRIIVHAKVSIIDDRLLRIGSTNLNNRSFGFDTECDVSIEPEDAAGRDAIRDHRHRSLGHFLGVRGPEFAAAEAVMGSTGAAIAAFDTGRLQVLGADPPSWAQSRIADWRLGDPMSVNDSWRPWLRRGKAVRRVEARNRTPAADGPTPPAPGARPGR